MTAIVAHIRWITIVSGVLTSTMIYAAIAPRAFGIAPPGWRGHSIGTLNRDCPRGTLTVPWQLHLEQSASLR